MDPVDRYRWHRRKFADKLGGMTSLSPATFLRLNRAASIAQTLEMVKHETMLGRAMDADSIQALEADLDIALAEAGLATERNTVEQLPAWIRNQSPKQRRRPR